MKLFFYTFVFNDELVCLVRRHMVVIKVIHYPKRTQHQNQYHHGGERKYHQVPTRPGFTPEMQEKDKLDEKLDNRQADDGKNQPAGRKNSVRDKQVSGTR